MAIPLYVPEEYGPSLSSSQQTLSLIPSSSNVPSCASFVHQLIVELCSIYHEYCAASPSSNGHVSEPARDLNNNSALELIQRPQRRRRHPAGATETLCSNHDMIPLPALAASGDLRHADRQRQNSEFECKLSVETNFGSIGLQLRQIADSYTVRTTNRKNQPVDSRKVGQKSSSGPSKNDGTSWSIRFTFLGSLLFLGASLTASVVLVKNK